MPILCLKKDRVIIDPVTADTFIHYDKSGNILSIWTRNETVDDLVLIDMREWRTVDWSRRLMFICQQHVDRVIEDGPSIYALDPMTAYKQFLED